MDRTPERREQVLRGAEAACQADGLLVSATANVTYLTGFTGDSSPLLLLRDRALLLSDGRYATQIEEECPGLEYHIKPVEQAMIATTAEVVGKLGIKRLAFEATTLTYEDVKELKRLMTGVELKATTDCVEAVRQVKDEEEIAAIRASIACAERAFTMFRAGLRLEETERDAADTLEFFLRRCGAESSSFPPIVAVGPRAALPHAQPGVTTRIGDAPFVLIDWGASRRSYKSDLTRVLVTGKVTPKFATVYRTVLAAQERAIATIRPGVCARDVDAEARSVIEEAGFGRFFDHGLGHGLGLEIHEGPRIRKGSEDTLAAGMVVTIEPGIYLPGWGGIRIEDDVVVTPDGSEVLTRVPKSLEWVQDGSLQ